MGLACVVDDEDQDDDDEDDGSPGTETPNDGHRMVGTSLDDIPNDDNLGGWHSSDTMSDHMRLLQRYTRRVGVIRAKERMYPVDGKVSCGFRLHCTLMPMDGGRYCAEHNDMLMTGTHDHTPKSLGSDEAIRWGRQDVSFHPPQAPLRHNPQRVSYPGVLERLHFDHANFVIWVIDCEFVAPFGANTIPFILTVRDVKTGAIIVSTTIDYGAMLLSDIVEELTKHQGQRGLTPFMCVEYMAGFYHGDRTSGLSMSAVGKILLDAGFTPNTHRVWGCTHHLTLSSSPAPSSDMTT
ncbi:hypothetical protein NX059_010192 [Plenodomus lindquistii]|nr:hypothetical protein NX059_010192 [Plenodomus lindquistii]